LVKAVRRKALLLAAFAALVAVSPARLQAEPTELMPGVTYTQEVKRIGGKQVVLHIVTAPRPGGLYRLVPVLSNGTVTGRETLTEMQARLSSTATVVGVNGDFFNWDLGYPSGIFMRGGVLAARPVPTRSSLGIGVDGLFRLGRIRFSGTWTIGDVGRASLSQLNRPVPRKGAGLFTSLWGAETPRAKNALDVVVTGFPEAVPGADLTGEVVEVRRGGGTAIPAGGAVLQARGSARQLVAAAEPGLPLLVRLLLRPSWEGVADAIGGGPSLVENGKIVLPTEESFSDYQLLPRHPRTAVGQLADGRVVLVVADGRQSWSAGLDLWQLARELVGLGVVNGMALDGGGSTAIAFDGRILSTPSDGAERLIANALMVLYHGVYAPAPAVEVASPNGDGVADRQTLAYKVVRSSTVSARLLGPGGKVVWKEQGAKDPGTYPLVLGRQELKEGDWRWAVSAVDEEGNESKAERRFSVNNTLGFLELSAERLKVTRKGKGKLRLSFAMAHKARVEVTVENRLGRVVRTLLAAARRAPGEIELAWNGRSGSGNPVAAGTYTIRVRAVNGIGKVDLTGSVQVERGKRRS
jgi:hypothetical protein